MAHFLKHISPPSIDYIFFFYGASFIALGAVCFSILRRSGETKGLAWWWLGLFGFMHGLNEWMDMVAVSLPFFSDQPLFTAVRHAVLLTSFVFLMEFARRSSFIVWKKRIQPHFYALLLIFVALGIRNSWTGFAALVRYGFGFPSAVWSALIFLFYHRTLEKPLSRESQVFLKASGIAMGCYGILTGCIVSPANFFPASVLNTETFLNTVGTPVQFFRGCCAFVVAVSVAVYAVKQSLMAFFKDEIFKAKHFAVLTSVTVLAVIGLFWAGLEAVDHYSYKVEQDEHVARQLRAQMFSQFVQMTVTRLEPIEALATNPAIVSALDSPMLTEAHIQDMNERLDRYRLAMKADVCYVMDKTGLTIASTNRDTDKSFVGKNYAFRPYFQEAIHGRPSVYLAKGVTSKERGIYVAYPVHPLSGGSPMGARGVVVAKDNLAQVAKAFATYPHVFLVSPEGIIFISSDPEMVFSSIRDFTSSEVAHLKDSKQFGEGPWKNLGFKEWDARAAKTTFKNKPYYFVTEPFADLPGWQILFLDDSGNVDNARFIMILIFVIFFLLVLSIALYVFRIYLDKLHISASEALYEALVEGSPDSVKLFNRAGRCLSINKAGLRMMGWRKEDALGKRFEDIWPSEYKDTVNVAVRGVLEGKQQSFEAKTKRSDGQILIKAVILAPIFEANGSIKYFIVIARDVTEERHSRERLLQSSKMATVGAMATGVAHEFNNVLEIIMGNAELAYTSQDCEMMKDTIKVIMDSTKRASRIIKNMLDFSATSSEVKEPLDVREILKQNILLLSRVFEAHNIAIETQLAAVPKVLGNAAQLSQVFFNIMLNARDAMRAVKEKKLTVSCIYDAGAGEVAICFQDTGVGIRAELKDKLFGPFVTTKGILGGGEDQEPGVGLGLYVAYGIVRQHNGIITVESEEGMGAKFCVSLPVIKP
ncbi:MAG: PAS domain S-box protein [Candidatus Omnitrophota bacterium]